MKTKIGFWVATGLFSLMMLGSAFAYLTGGSQVVEGFHHLGYPDYFRTMLGVAKVLGVVALVAPGVPRPVREWAYAGFAITTIAAAVSHAVSGDALGKVLMPLIALAVLATSRALVGTRDPSSASPRPASGSAPALPSA
jgi:DoxX-like family